VPQREFTSITDGHLSLTIANRGLPEVEVLTHDSGNTEIALTLIRCIGWLSRDDITTRKGHAGPMGIETPDAQLLGKYGFDYSIIPGYSEWHRSIHEAIAFNSPMRSINTSIHSGILSHETMLIENNNQNFIITAIKVSEDDNHLIVRGFNLLSTPIDIYLKPWMPFKYAHLTRLDEKFISELAISPDGRVNMQVGGNKIITIRYSN
jgi:alpha-mannosidase